MLVYFIDRLFMGPILITEEVVDLYWFAYHLSQTMDIAREYLNTLWLIELGQDQGT